MFVELDELFVGDRNELEWREQARWIKFEEDVEEGAERWGKPHVASLSFHSLLDLRRCLEKCKLLNHKATPGERSRLGHILWQCRYETPSPQKASPLLTVIVTVAACEVDTRTLSG